jgi:hypothetical protein
MKRSSCCRGKGSRSEKVFVCPKFWGVVVRFPPKLRESSCWEWSARGREFWFRFDEKCCDASC